MLTLTDIALNVNRLEQSFVRTSNSCASDEQCGDADNIKIKRNNFFEGFVRLSKCVQVINSFGYLKCVAFNPSKKLLL